MLSGVQHRTNLVLPAIDGNHGNRMREDADVNIAISQSITISLAMLTSKPAYSILCGLSIIAPLVLHPLQPQDCSPPGSCITLLCYSGIPQLATMLHGGYFTTTDGVCKYSAQELLHLCCNFTPNSIAKIKFLGLLRCQRYMHRASRCKFIHTDNTIPLHADCGAAIPSMLTDRPSIALAQRIKTNHRCATETLGLCEWCRFLHIPLHL